MFTRRQTLGGIAVLTAGLLLFAGAVVDAQAALTCNITQPNSNVTINVGGTVNYTGTVSGGRASYTFTWTFNGGTPSSRSRTTSSTSDSTTVTYNTAGTFTTTLAVRDSSSTRQNCAANPTRTITVGGGGTGTTSINSTSQNKIKPASAVAQQPQVIDGSKGYRVIATNDLGMHCGDLDHRIASILPPFNVLHTQVIKLGTGTGSLRPQVQNNTQVDVYFSSAANANDPVFPYTAPAGYTNPPAGSNTVYKTNFWQCASGIGQPQPGTCAATATIEFEAYNPHYPPNILSAFTLAPDVSLPMPDVERLYLGDHALSADQVDMPGISNPTVANLPQLLPRYNTNFPFFINFPFGYTVNNVRWFQAEGVPATVFDDFGRLNAYPLMRVSAVIKGADPKNAANVLATLDTVAPVSGEADCKNCHTTSFDGGNGLATAPLSNPATQLTDPLHGQVPTAVSIEYAADVNLVNLHDLNEGSKYVDNNGNLAPCDTGHPQNCLANQVPISCQRCHYSPALDLAQLGPIGPSGKYPADTFANGRQQRMHESNSRVMHNFHGQLDITGKSPGDTGYNANNPLFPNMPGPSGRSGTTTQTILQASCYQCHPGKNTKCLRGIMSTNNVVCQDCHGQMKQVGNDFTQTVSVSSPNSFILNGSVRVPWANEPGCGSCHTGDAVSNLAGSANVVKHSDGINLIQAYFTNDANAKPIVPTNKRFAEPAVTTANGTVPGLYRVSIGHINASTGNGVYCQGCHGSTHAEWPNANANANDNVPAVQAQGHTGLISECSTCHGTSMNNVRTLNGPHGMHPVGSGTSWANGGHSGLVSGNNCVVCHGANATQSGRSQNVGTALSKALATRTLHSQTITAGTPIGCKLCHG